MSVRAILWGPFADQQKITNCKVVPATEHNGQIVENAVQVTIGGKTRELFSYFIDEHRFTAADFIGKTEAEAIALFVKRDAEYLFNFAQQQDIEADDVKEANIVGPWIY